MESQEGHPLLRWTRRGIVGRLGNPNFDVIGDTNLLTTDVGLMLIADRRCYCRRRRFVVVCVVDRRGWGQVGRGQRKVEGNRPHTHVNEQQCWHDLGLTVSVS